MRATVVLGLVGAAVAWGLGWALSITGSCALIVGTAVVLDDAEHLRRGFLRTARVTLALVGAAGMVSAFKWSGAGLLGVLALAWLVLPRPADDLRPEDDEPAELVLPPPEPLFASAVDGIDAESVSDLDDENLCLAWRRSFQELDTASPGRRAEVVNRRQLYLDELERRHPVELRRWLKSGARASGNPLRYLSKGR